MKTFGLGCLFNILLLVFLFFVAIAAHAYIQIPLLIYIPVGGLLFFFAYLITKNEEENTQGDNHHSEGGFTLNSDMVRYAVQNKYNLGIKQIYLKESFDITVYHLESLRIKYFAEEVKPYLNLSMNADNNVLRLMYVKTEDNEDRFIYYIKNLKTQVPFSDIVFMTAYPLHYTVSELKAELAKIDNRTVQTKILPLLESEKIEYSINKSSTPVLNFNPETNPDMLGELPVLLSDGTNSYSVTYLGNSLYIFDVTNNEYIFPAEMTQSQFQEAYK